MSHWFAVMTELDGLKYADQMSVLQETHGFSRAHANALVLYSRGSTTTRRYASHSEYFATLDPVQAKTARSVFAAIRKHHPSLKSVIAWNQPMLKTGKHYVFGLSAAKRHLTIATWNPEVIAEFRNRLDGLETTKKTIRVPNDWKVDVGLLGDMVSAQLRLIDAT